MLMNINPVRLIKSQATWDRIGLKPNNGIGKLSLLLLLGLSERTLAQDTKILEITDVSWHCSSAPDKLQTTKHIL
jgi:hypothetical protein